nr:hypothetical protein [Tanacetum cinerariifolium]
MSTQQDIYAAGSESRPPMLNKENYVPWSSRLLQYAKSRPNGKLIHNSILNGPYVRKLIPEPSDANREITVTETFHLQTDDELSDKELKQIEADDQAIQTILLGLPEDIYAAVDKKIASNLKFLNNLQPEWSRHVTIVHQTKDLHTADYTQLYDFLKYNQKENYLQQPMPDPEDITDPTTAMNMTLALMAKTFKLNYSTPTNNNQRISSNPKNGQIRQPGMNMGQDRQMPMVRGNGGNQFRQYARQNAGNLAGYNDVIGNQVIQNAVQNPRVQNVGNPNGLIGVQGNGNQNQIGNGEYDLMAAAADLDEIEEVNANCILMANLQQASTSEEQYAELLEPIPESHQVPQNDNDVISEKLVWNKQMMKGSDIGIQEKKAKLFNERERFTSNEGESTESYYHHFLKLMNDLKRNKHFPEKIASNLKFLNNLQPEWSRHKEVDELKAERLAKTQDPLALMANSNNPYVFPAPHQDQPSFNRNYLQQPMPNPEDITDPTTAMNMALALMAKAFKLNYSTPTNNNQRISSNPRNMKITQSKNPAGYNDVIGNQVIQNVVQNPRVQNVGNQNGLIGVQGNGNQNQIGNDNLVATRAEGNAAGQNGNQLRCYSYRGVGHYARNYTQASTSSTQTNNAPVYDTDRSAENTTGFTLDYFKGMTYDDIRPIFEAKFNANIEFLLKSKEQLEEEESRAIAFINETPAQKAAKKRRLNEEAEDVEELKQHLEIVPDEDDDVYTKATPLARKVPVMDYQIVYVNNKPRYKIIRADDTY